MLGQLKPHVLRDERHDQLFEEADGVLVEVLLQSGVELLLVAGASQQRVEGEDGQSAAGETALGAAWAGLATGFKRHGFHLLPAVSETAENGVFSVSEP